MKLPLLERISSSLVRHAVLRRILVIVGLLVVLTFGGATGFQIITGARWFDCLYMAVITLTTVGYGEAVPLDDVGRAFVMVYLVLGVGIFTYTAYQMGQIIVSGELRSLIEERRMEQKIEHLHGHFIVCGAGRMGLTICRHLREHHKRFVVVDIDPAKREMCNRENWLCLTGDATDDVVLERAGIARAQALASALPTDADNVYVVLSARLLSTNLEIVSRASNEKVAAKMERAGATRVVSPFSAGALKMARFMLNPEVEDFLDIANSRGQGLEMVDVQITARSPFLGKQLQETDLSRLGVMVVGIRRADGEQLMPPPAETTLCEGDCLFAFGLREAVQKMLAETEGET